jgi:hypothetical protein
LDRLSVARRDSHGFCGFGRRGCGRRSSRGVQKQNDVPDLEPLSGLGEDFLNPSCHLGGDFQGGLAGFKLQHRLIKN